MTKGIYLMDKTTFKLNTQLMQQNEDMLAEGSEKVQTTPVYGIGNPQPNIFYYAHEESYLQDCLKLKTEDPDRDEIVIANFGGDDLTKHNQHMKVFNPKIVKSVRFVPLAQDDGKMIFWPMKQTKFITGQEKEHKAHSSARKCWKKAQEGWHHIYWDDGLYVATKDECSEIQDNIQPNWPTEKWNMSMQEIFAESVQAVGNFITSMDDKRIRDLRFGSANK